MPVAQCEKSFRPHQNPKRSPAEDTAGSVREVLARGDKSSAAIAGRCAAEHYHGVILAESIQDNAENFTRFVLLIPVARDGCGESANSVRASSPPAPHSMLELPLNQMHPFTSD